MINCLPDLIYYIKADHKSMCLRVSLKSFALDPVARFTIAMRLYEYIKNTQKPSILLYPAKLWFRCLSLKLGFSLGPNIFGPGVAIVHHGLLIINPTTRIGKNCRIHMGAHIGGAAICVDAGLESEYSPRIGDNVYIGPGAKIYGQIRIGNNCAIGANAVVNKSFPEDGLTIAGVPAKIVASGGAVERVIRGAD